MTYEQMRKQESFAGWDFAGSSADGTIYAWTLSSADAYPSLSVFGAYEPPALPGSGTEADPYRIESAEGLGAIYYRPDLHYRLIGGIDCSGIRWTGSIIPYFTGRLAGGRSSLSNLQIVGEDTLGLFGVLAMQGTASDLVFDHVEIDVGELCGHIGSLAGKNEGMAQDCGVLDAGMIHGDSYDYRIGGLIGQNSGIVRRCSSCLPIQVDYRGYYVGGLVGSNTGFICECHAGSEIVLGDDSYRIGGLLGTHGSGIITNSYACGSIVVGSGSEGMGGLVGSGADVEKCYRLAFADGGGPDSGPGASLTQTQMCQQASFVGWDFAGETTNGTRDIWTICEGKDYPRLSWEQVECDQ